MTTPDSSAVPANGSPNGPLAVSPAVPSGSESLAARVAMLEARINELEAEQLRFRNALHFAGKFIMENPASKMILMSLPKEMKTKLQEYFGK